MRLTFRLADLALVHFNSNGHDGGVILLLNDAKISGLPARRIQVSSLDFPKPGHCLPHPSSQLDRDCIICLAESNRERRGGWIVFNDGRQVLIQNTLETGAITVAGRGEKSACTDRGASKQMDKPGRRVMFRKHI